MSGEPEEGSTTWFRALESTAFASWSSRKLAGQRQERTPLLPRMLSVFPVATLRISPTRRGSRENQGELHAHSALHEVHLPYAELPRECRADGSDEKSGGRGRGPSRELAAVSLRRRGGSPHHAASGEPRRTGQVAGPSHRTPTQRELYASDWLRDNRHESYDCLNCTYRGAGSLAPAGGGGPSVCCRPRADPIGDWVNEGTASFSELRLVRMVVGRSFGGRTTAAAAVLSARAAVWVMRGQTRRLPGRTWRLGTI